ncbi:MAG: DUF1616 domain-containing protein [Candidatus Bathyarchaeota archaeon]|nr:DUF1616 domain-containing protein [Candidatus Bathyarchaeota archaeon]
MNLNDYKLIFIVTGLIGILLISSPAIGMVLHLPMEQPFSSIFLLGSTQKFSDYPYNVTEGTTYPLHLCVENREGEAAYYKVEMGLRNRTDLIGNETDNVQNPTQPLLEHKFLCQNGQIVQKPLNFMISNVTYSSNQSVINKIAVNGVKFEVNTLSIWDSEKQGFPYEIFFDLYIYKTSVGSFESLNQSLNLKLNLQPISQYIINAT